MTVDRACFFVCHKSTSTLNICLIDAKTGQSLHFLNKHRIDSNLYKNIIVDILSLDNTNKYSNRVKFFDFFTKKLKENSSTTLFDNKMSFLKINSPKYTRFNIKADQSFFDINKVVVNSFVNHSYSDLYKDFSTLRVSIIKVPVFIRKVEPHHNNVIAVFKNIMLHDIYRDKTNYLRLS